MINWILNSAYRFPPFVDVCCENLEVYQEAQEGLTKINDKKCEWGENVNPLKILLGKNQIPPKPSTSRDVEQAKLQRRAKIINPHKILSSQISYPKKDIRASSSLFYMINYPSHWVKKAFPSFPSWQISLLSSPVQLIMYEYCKEKFLEDKLTLSTKAMSLALVIVESNSSTTALFPGS